MLDTIALTWFTNSAASPARTHRENRTATTAGPRLVHHAGAEVAPA